MLHLTLKNLVANRVRLALTGFAVVLAVSFVVSSFVLTDGLRQSFGDLSTDIIGGTDYEVRAGEEPDPAPIDEALLEEVLAVEGVDNAIGVVVAENQFMPVKPDGETISVNGPPQMMFGWDDDSRLTSFTLESGRTPGQDEFTMDFGSAERHGFEVGQTYDFATANGIEQMELVGLTRFGPNNDTLGATLMHTDGDSLMALLGQTEFDSIVVAAAGGADRSMLQANLETTASGLEVVNQATLASEAAADFNQFVDIFNNVLLGFAGVSLFVSTFIIANTFAIVLSQRTRELALLRTIGADPGQLTRSVLAEATVIGLLASIAGIAGGAGLAIGLREVFQLLGADLPDAPTVVTLRTVLVALAVGVVVTVLSAVVPALKAARVAPMAALRDGGEAGSATGTVRLLIGSVLALAGLAAGSAGLFVAESTTGIITLLAIGAIAVFIGVTMISPLMVSPVTSALGWPASRALGVTGGLAQQNAGRNRQRTASTAAALMIGLAVVSMTLVVGESLKAELRSTLTSSVQADYLAVDDSDGFTPIPEATVARFDELAVIDTVTSFRYGTVELDGEAQDTTATDLAATDVLFDLGLTAGVGTDESVEHPVLVSSGEAAAKGLSVGDQLALSTEDGASATGTVIGVFSNNAVAGDPYMIDLDTWAELGQGDGIAWMAMSLADGVTSAQAEAAFAPLEADVPQMAISTASNFVATIEGQVDQLLTVVNAMVALAVLIALVGIANTLALSVFERTRELGLLRAVGMSRRQVRSMIRIEAALVALFGAALGVALGVLFGWGAVEALPDSMTSTLSVPVSRIALLVVVSGTAGLVAAWGPARRAGKLNVLDAISG